MTDVCPTCRQPISAAAVNSTGAGDSGDRRKVTPWLKGRAFLLSKNAACKEDWKKFLGDIGRYDSLSPKQTKFFAVIHKECMGEWPPREDPREPELVPFLGPEEIPF